MHIFFIFIIPVCSKFHVRIQLCSDANSKTKISFAAKGAPQGEVERKKYNKFNAEKLGIFRQKTFVVFPTKPICKIL